MHHFSCGFNFASRYIGAYFNGERHGQGIKTYSNGQRYIPISWDWSYTNNDKFYVPKPYTHFSLSKPKLASDIKIACKWEKSNILRFLSGTKAISTKTVFSVKALGRFPTATGSRLSFETLFHSNESPTHLRLCCYQIPGYFRRCWKR